MILQDLKDNLENDSKTILQYEEVEGTKVARIEPWEKKDYFLNGIQY